MSYEFRVQFVDDVDPFNVLASLKHAEPTVPKKYKFAGAVPLCDQIPGLKKHLRAPHKVRVRMRGGREGRERMRAILARVAEVLAEFSLLA